jgi:hypothetical protein
LIINYQHKIQQQVKFGPYAKSLVKKCCVFNPNEATYDFYYAPSRLEKRRITVSYAGAAVPEFAETSTENIDLTMDDPSLLTVSKHVTKLMELKKVSNPLNLTENR